jgi:hypothetical protein
VSSFRNGGTSWRCRLQKRGVNGIYILYTGCCSPFKSFVELRPVGGGGEIKWLVSYFNMLRRVVLSVPKHGDTQAIMTSRS